VAWKVTNYGTALAMHPTLCGISNYELSGLRKGEEHSIYTSVYAYKHAYIIQISPTDKYIQTTKIILRNSDNSDF